MHNTINRIGEKIEGDRGLKSIKRQVLSLSIVIAVIAMGEIEVHKVNTFFIEFSVGSFNNVKNLLYILLIFLVIRYYGFSEEIRKELSSLWAKKLMSDPEVFELSSEHDLIFGHLTKVTGDIPDPSILSAEYVVGGCFRRGVVYWRSVDPEAPSERVYISLNKFNEKWSAFDFLKILWVEFRCQLSVVFQMRYSIEIFAPYIFAIFAIVISLLY
ncbi:hypothetical protein EDC38_1547 [Marinimicrobium koreense]|uniref:Uncharacterized protein n=1 Tax=Marinimicrobium koreense TaxID=306545 RepID=A0A3N1NYN8_9GAMM|nr:hypothetical protein [Marinimicrobium koreense]ROQ20929.1 hypothetical protein EDC38_1547 [Marinimicrobium koreense]